MSLASRGSAMTLTQTARYRWIRYRVMAALACTVFAGTAAGQLPEQSTHAAIPFVAADVSSSDGRVFVVAWRAAGIRQVRVVAGTDPAQISRDHTLAKGGGTGEVTVSDLPSA